MCNLPAMTMDLETAMRCRFGGASWRAPRWDGLDTGWRELPMALLETPRKGSWRVEVPGKSFLVEEGGTLLVGGGVRHRMVVENASGRMVSSWVFVEWESGGRPLGVLGGAVVKRSPGLAAKVETLAAQKDAAGLAELAERVGRAFAVLSEIAELVDMAPAPDPRVARAMRWAGQNYDKPVRRADLARAAGVSEAHLQDLFREAAGVSPMDFVIRLRLRRAMELLAGGGMSVGEVAERSGFASPYYFSRFFKKRTGMTPGEYRAGRPH